MLKRAWIVISVLWSLLILAFQRDPASVAFAVAIPWSLGLIVWISWRFIRGRRRNSEPGIVHYH